jgi:predicted membrane GTPase involved in stress response
MNSSNFKIGDLIKLKGFKKLDINETPVGIIIANLGLDKYKINWTDDRIARRFGLTAVMHIDKMELISAI